MLIRIHLGRRLFTVCVFGREEFATIAFGLFTLSFLFAASPAQADEIDDFVLRQMEQFHVPGLAMAIVRDGKIVRTEEYGVASLETRAPVHAGSVFEIASVTKPFTATLAVLLSDDGLLDLDAPIGNYLSNIPQRWHPVTARQLMNHSAGLPNYSGGDYITLFRNEHTDDQIIDIVRDKPLDFPPGSEREYSNTNFFVLSMLVEKVTGRPIGEIFRANILDPLGMRDTRMTDPLAIVPWRVDGYRRIDGQFVNTDVHTPSSSKGAGGLISTASDMAKWIATFDRGALVGPERFTAMTRGRSGWDSQEQFGVFSVEHRGLDPGFNSGVIYLPGKRLGAVVLTNHYLGNAYGIARGILAQLEPTMGLTRATLPPRPDPNPQLTEQLELVMQQMGRRDTSSPLITEALRGGFNEANMRFLDQHHKGASELTFLYEEDVSGKNVERFDAPVATIKHYRLKTDAGFVYPSIFLAADNRIVDFDTYLD